MTEKNLENKRRMIKFFNIKIVKNNGFFGIKVFWGICLFKEETWSMN